MTNQATRRFQAQKDYILRNVAGSTVLISVGGNIANFNGYVQLNETAAFLWGALSEPKTVEELTSALCGEFDVSREEAQKDVDDFLKELLEADMVIVNE